MNADPKPWRAPLSKALLEKQQAAPTPSADEEVIALLTSEVARIGRSIHALQARRALLADALNSGTGAA